MSEAVATRLLLLLQKVEQACGEALVLAAGRKPEARGAQGLLPLPAEGVLDRAALDGLLAEALGAEHLLGLRERGFLEVALQLGSRRAHARCTVARDGLHAVLRPLPAATTLQALELPKAVTQLAQLETGLLLIAGPRGSGKTTTVAALCRELSRVRARRIVVLGASLELTASDTDPWVLREHAVHCDSVEAGIAAALRTGTDVLVLDPLEAPAHRALVLDAATLPLLVVVTLRAAGVSQALSQLAARDGAAAQARAYAQLAEGLAAAVSLERIPTTDASYVQAAEILLRTQALPGLLRDGKLGALGSLLEAGSPAGMQSMDSVLVELVKQGRIEPREAYVRATDKRLFPAG